MGFFDKLKTFVGQNEPPIIEFQYLEDVLPITDTGIKYRINVSSKQVYTIISVESTIKACFLDDTGTEITELLASETDTGEHWLESDNPFPGTIDANTSWQYPGSIFWDDEKSDYLQTLKNKQGLKLNLEVTIDAKEIGGLFDPSIKSDIKLVL